MSKDKQQQVEDSIKSLLVIIAVTVPVGLVFGLMYYIGF